MYYNTTVVGGGISGLSAAYYLQKHCAQSGQEHSYAILESSDKWGGKISTKKIQLGDCPDLIIEEGGDCLMSSKPYGLDLVKELDCQEALLNSNPKHKQTWVFVKNKLIRMPEGLMLMVPTRFLPFAVSSLISTTGKFRMLLELAVSRNKTGYDQSLASFIKRRMGNEVLEKIVEPMVGGIFGADPERQSLLATFPHFAELEKRHGSLLLAFVKARFSKKHKSASAHSPFVYFKGGMNGFINAIINSLKGRYSLGVKINQISKLSSGAYVLKLDDNSIIITNSLILSTPAQVSAQLLQDIAPLTSSLLKRIRYVSSGNISLIYKKSDLIKFPSGSGALIAKSENRFINAVSFSSQKFSGRSASQYQVLRASFGGSRDPQATLLDDQTIADKVLSDLKAILNIDARPIVTHIKKWQDAMPQYDLGHLELLDLIEKSLPKGIFLANCCLRGVSIPDCINQGKKAALAAASDQATFLSNMNVNDSQESANYKSLQ